MYQLPYSNKYFEQVIFSVVGVLNMLRGFFIFLVFICKRSVWKMVTKKYPKFVALLYSAKRRFQCTSADATADNLSDEKFARKRVEETTTMTTKINIVIKTEEIVTETNF